MATTSLTSAQTDSSDDALSIVKRGALAALASIVTSASIIALAIGAFGVDTTVDVNGQRQTIGALMVVPITVITTALATALAAILARRSANWRRPFIIVGGIATVLSLASVVGAVTMGGKVVLAFVHLTTGLIVVGGIAGALERLRSR